MSFNLKDYFDELYKEDYQRENFDEFLKKVNFKYTVPSIHISGPEDLRRSGRTSVRKP